MNALGSLPGIIAGAMGQTLFRAATLHKSRGGVQRSCRALVVEFTDWQRAQGMQAFEGLADVPATIPSSDRNVIILAATLADTPKASDTLVIDGGAWRIHSVKSDPANATYECRSTRCPIPSGDTTEADSETLLDDLPDIMNGALGPALFSPAILYKVTGRIGDGRGGFVSTFSEYQCSAIITDYSDFARSVDGIPAKDRKVLILSASLPGYVIVKPNDIIVIADQAWGLVKVDQDPAGATYEGQGSPARLPTVGRIGTAAISLRDATLSAQGTSRIVASANITLRDALAVGSSSITLNGALAVTLADATVAGVIDFTNRGALAVTLANATVAGQGSPVGEGQGAGMLVSATLNAQGSPRITGALAATLANASIEASGPISGELAKNLANASLVATGAVRTIGALSYQLADATLQASGVGRIVGALAVTLADATGVGVASSQINGSLSLTINDATLSATGVLRVNGSLSQALADGTVSSAGYQRNAGAVGITLDGSTLAATGSPRVTGALAITLDNSQLIAGAANVGQLGITLAGSTLAAAGYQANWGVLAVTLNDATLSAAGSSYVQGAGAATLVSATVISEGYQRNAGALAVTLSDATLSASSDLAVTGSAAITLENSIAVSNGSIQNPGQLARALDDSALIAAGYQRNTGALAATLNDATLSADASIRLNGAGASTLNSATVISEGYQRNAGSLAATLQDATALSTGVLAIHGALAVTLSNSTLTATADLAPIGSLAVTLDSSTVSAVGTPTNSAALAQTLANATTAFTGTSTIQGALAKTLSDAILEAFGENGDTGFTPVIPEIVAEEFEISLGDGAVTVAVPAGTVDGDMLIAMWGGDGVANIPAGWRRGPVFQNAINVSWFWRIADSEPADYTFTGSGSPTYCVGSIMTISDADPYYPFENRQRYGTGYSDTRSNIGFETEKNNSLLLVYTDGDVDYIMPGGWELATGNAATNVAMKVEPDAGDVSAFSAIMSGAAGWETFSVGVRAADPVGSVYNVPVVISEEWAVAGGASVNVDVPADVSDGDMMIAYANSDQVLNAVAGWTSAHAYNPVGPDMQWFWRIADSEPADYTFTATSGGYILAGIMKVSGVDMTSPFIAQHSGATGNNLSGGRLNSGIDASHAEVMLLCYSDGTSNTTDPYGWTKVSGATGSNVIAKMAGVAGETGALEIAQVSNGFYFTHMVGLRPAAILPNIIYDDVVVESSVSDDNASSATITVDMPAGVEAGDLLVATITETSSGIPGTPAIPAGWIGLDFYRPYGLGAVRIVWKIADGTEVDETFSTGSGSSTQGLFVTIHRISGANTSSPFEPVTSKNAADSATRSNDGITTSRPGTLLLMYTNGASFYVEPAPSGWTYAEPLNGTVSPPYAWESLQNYANVMFKTIDEAGDAGLTSWSQDISGVWATFQIGVRPAVISSGEGSGGDPIDGEVAITLVDAGLSAAGTPNNVGVLAQTLANATLVATGTMNDPAPVIQGTVVTRVTGATTSDTINKPTGATVGELLLMLVGQYQGIGGTDAITTPSGWRLAPFGMQTSFVTGIGTINMYAFYRWCDGTEGSTFPINVVSSNIPAIHLNTMCMRISGVDATNPFGAGASANGANNSTRNMATLSTDEDNSLLLAYTLGWNQALSGGFSGMTQVAVMDTVTELYRENIATTGSVSAKNATQAGSDGWQTFGLSLRPGAGGGVNPAAVPTFVASGALSTATSQTSRTPAAPSGATTDDVEIVTCASENNATHSYSGSGWTKGGQINSGAGWTVSWGWRRRTGSNVDPVISWTGTADASARRHAYRGCITSGTPVAAIGTAGTGTGSTHTSTGGNTTAENSLVIYLDHALANTALGQPTGWTENTDSGSATGPVRTAVGRKAMGASGSASGNISVTGAAAAWVNLQLELKAN